MQLNIYLAVSYGTQSVSLPPFMFKFVLEPEYHLSKKVSVYAYPGISVGMAPFVGFHFETGFALKWFTIDYSTNLFKSIVDAEEGEDTAPKVSNGNINLGLKMRLGKKK